MRGVSAAMFAALCSVSCATSGMAGDVSLGSGTVAAAASDAALAASQVAVALASVSISATSHAAPRSATLGSRDHGVRCDGTADDTASLNAFLALAARTAASQGSAVALIQGDRCTLRGSMSVRIVDNLSVSGISADGRTPRATFRCEGDGNGWCIALEGGGRQAEKIALAAPAPRLARSIVVADAASLRAGQHITIIHSPTGDRNHDDQGQFNRIVSIAGDRLTLAYPLTFPISAPANAFIQYNNTVASGVRITGLHVDGSAIAAGTRSAVLVSNVANAVISDLSAVNFGVFNDDGVGQQAGISIQNCDGCGISRLSAEAVSGESLYFFGITGSVISDIRATRAGGPGGQVNYTSLTLVRNYTVDGARGRALKLYGTTGTRFDAIRLRGSRGALYPSGRYENYTGFSLSSASSYNTVTDLTVADASACVWLNGTGNSSNRFRGVRTSDCVLPDGLTGAPLPGHDIEIGATGASIDADNTFEDLVTGAARQINDGGLRTAIR